MQVLAVDDEPQALEDLTRMLRASPLVGSVSTAENGRDALLELTRGHYDALFLDVRMPRIEGVELAKLLSRFADPPAIVFVTGHQEAAVDAFELRAVDYILKPVRRERLDTALARVAATLPPPAPEDAETSGEPETEDADVIPVDDPATGATRLLRRSSILHCQSQGDYVRITSDQGTFLLRTSLSTLEERWQAHGFHRVHRAYVANLRRAVELRPAPNGTAVLVFEDGSEVPIARRQVADLRRRLKL